MPATREPDVIGSPRVSSRVRHLASRVVPGRRAQAEAQRLRAQLARSRTKLERVTGRLETAKAALAEARSDARNVRARIARSEATIASLTSDLSRTHETLAHYMSLDREHSERLAEGRAALFDYPVAPRPRTFARPGKDFFGDIMAASDDRVAELLREIGPSLAPLAELSEDETDPSLPFWSNPWLPPLDGATLYGLIATRRPSLYMEVGSGFSTKFARLASATTASTPGSCRSTRSLAPRWMRSATRWCARPTRTSTSTCSIDSAPATCCSSTTATARSPTPT